MSRNERTHIAIIGAGIVGLSFAVALNALDKDRKYSIDLYEAAPELSEIGAGIHIWPNTLKILREIGVEQTLVPSFDHHPDLEPRIIFSLRKSDQQDGFNVYDVMNDGGAVRIHRADLQRGLIQHLPLSNSNTIQINSPCTLHLCHRLTDYTYDSPDGSGPLTLHFDDNKPSTTCDILIGADGIKSTMRQRFLSRLPNPQKYEKYVETTWSGIVAYRGLVSREDLEQSYPGHRILTHPGLYYIGKTRVCLDIIPNFEENLIPKFTLFQYVLMYPVSGGKFVNVVAILRENPRNTKVWEGPWRVDVTQEEFLEVYKGFEEELLALLRCIKNPTKWSLQLLDHLDIFAKGRVILMGDSAHAMLPHLGAAATVGMEAAYILASILTHCSIPRSPSIENINLISTIYNTVCVPHANHMSKISTETGKILSLHTPEFEEYGLGDDIPRDLLENAFRQVEENYCLWTTSDPDGYRRKAEELLQKEMAL